MGGMGTQPVLLVIRAHSAPERLQILKFRLWVLEPYSWFGHPQAASSFHVSFSSLVSRDGCKNLCDTL